MKKLLLSIYAMILLGCVETNTKTSQDNDIKLNKPFTIDSIQFTMFDISPNYARLSSDKIATIEDIQKMRDSIIFLGNKILYIHYKDFRERGEDYAQVINGVITMIDNPITNEFEASLAEIKLKIWTVKSKIEMTNDFTKSLHNVDIDIFNKDKSTMNNQLSLMKQIIDDKKNTLSKHDIRIYDSIKTEVRRVEKQITACVKKYYK